MAAPLDIPKEEVRMLVLNVGPREAARQCGLNENTVLQWCRRFGWLAHLKPEKQPVPPKSMQAQPVINVIKPADALANTLADDSKASRIALSRGLRKGAEHVAQLPGEEILAKSGNVRDLTTSLEKLHGWSGAQANVRVSVFAGPQPVEIEAEVVRLDQCGTEQDGCGTGLDTASEPDGQTGQE